MRLAVRRARAVLGGISMLPWLLASDLVSPDLGYLMLFSEMGSGLSYSLWALPDLFDPPSCLVWLLCQWGRPKNRSVSLRFVRYLTSVSRQTPPQTLVSPIATMCDSRALHSLLWSNQ